MGKSMYLRFCCSDFCGGELWRQAVVPAVVGSPTNAACVAGMESITGTGPVLRSVLEGPAEAVNLR